jgi:hypothetical protein
VEDLVPGFEGTAEAPVDMVAGAFAVYDDIYCLYLEAREGGVDEGGAEVWG